jgi:ubiquinone/menaquinone biosynthesis C-methylase UbiE
MRVTAIEGHRHWASRYDADLNPLLALETRLLAAKLSPSQAGYFLDVACGTGRWMQWARRSGSRAFGIDLCPDMLLEASRKPGVAGCITLADACHVPIAGGVADLTLCSFALGYMSSPDAAIAEMARITRKGAQVVIADLHPAALAAGWSRSFRSNGRLYEIDHYPHTSAAWETAAESAGLALDWRIDGTFGEPEREIFRQAGKGSLFAEVSCVPALLAMSWIKS